MFQNMILPRIWERQIMNESPPSDDEQWWITDK
jgi:hypothetical protein